MVSGRRQLRALQLTFLGRVIECRRFAALLNSEGQEMPRHTLPTLRFLTILFAIVSGALITSAGADNQIPFYSGDFESENPAGTFWGPGSPQVGETFIYNGSNRNLWYEFSFSAPIDNFQETPWCGYDCPQYATGTIGSGTVSFTGGDYSGNNPNYNFTGFILAGGTFSGEVLCDPVSCAWDESVDFRFQSQSGTNGWSSTGEVNMSGGNDGQGQGQDLGILSMTTRSATTPEPSSVLLFGSGLMCVIGVMRRKRS
jgi:hypothetical protein